MYLCYICFIQENTFLFEFFLFIYLFKIFFYPIAMYARCSRFHRHYACYWRGWWFFDLIMFHGTVMPPSTINHHSSIQVSHLSLSFAFVCAHCCGRLMAGLPVRAPVRPCFHVVDRWALLTPRLYFCILYCYFSGDLQAICSHRFYASCSIILKQLFVCVRVCVLFCLACWSSVILWHISRLSS